MNFAEARFWELLAMGLAVILIVRSMWKRTGWNLQPFDKAALGALGIFLLGAVSWVTLYIFLAVAIGTYFGLALILKKPPAKRFKYLFVLVPLQLLPLAYYKYADFLGNGVLGLDLDFVRHLAIPVGISFYTFQKVAFVVDTLHFRKPLPRFLDYLIFASFFPQIVAGPIERRESLLPQMEAFRFRWLPQSIDQGIGWIVLGFFFKCGLADNLALYFDPASQTNAYLIWFANLLFGLRIYYDFAGYSLIALGIARCFGVQLTLNFASPYTATNATDFWRRWHITLSQWFRDYLYIPLGGARVRWWAFNVLLVFCVSGIWHGAGWNFLIWGGIHGTLLIVHRIGGKRIRLPRVIGWIATMIAVYAAWLSFYELRPEVLMRKFATLATPAAYNASALREALARWFGPDLLILVTILFITLVVLIVEWRSVAGKESPYRLLLNPKVLVVLVIATILLAPGRQNEFIYFAF
jgi:alginate O-acetyltransferase complex protein AlgI